MKTISPEFWEDQQWGFAHHGDLLKQFKNQWIAISNKKVICSGTNLGKVQENAKRITQKNETPIMFVESGSHLY